MKLSNTTTYLLADFYICIYISIFSSGYGINMRLRLLLRCGKIVKFLNVNIFLFLMIFFLIKQKDKNENDCG